jgi:hypothetical protein
MGSRPTARGTTDVKMGEWPHVRYVCPYNVKFASALPDESPLVREHAAWALRRTRQR